MPNENDKPVTAPAVPDPRDAQVAALEATVKDLQEKLAKKPKEKAAAAPEGDYVVLKGKTYEIERTVEAKFATDEWRKGYLADDAELIVIKRG